MKYTHLNQKNIFTILFGIIVLLFWGLTYRYHLAYSEQYQMFLFTPDYFLDRFAHPGGVGEYIGEFFTQFYYYQWIGVMIISLLLMLIQRQVWILSRAIRENSSYYLLSFIPSIALWAFLCDENAMLSFIVSICFVLFSIYLYNKVKTFRFRFLYLILVLPLVYWFFGGAYLIFITWGIINEVLNFISTKSKNQSISLLLVFMLWGVSLPLIAEYFVQYPLSRLIIGINYYRFPTGLPVSGIVALALTALTPFIIAKLPSINKRKILYTIAQGVVICGLGVYAISISRDIMKEEVMHYDYLTRTYQWQKIIKLAEKKSPKAPFSVTCLNLALAKTDQLSNRMFEFFQNGTEGLLCEFQRDYMSTLPTSEAFYHLGMINTAQRFTFEAMEAIPDYKKSARLYKRLVETNLINGQYDISRKYLNVLKKTLFYSTWATEMMSYLGNENKINSHPEYGWLRQILYKDDFLFSNPEMDIMLGFLFQTNKKNKMAFEYLMAYVLEQKNLEKTIRYYPLGKTLGYSEIPRSYQEALIYVWTQKYKSFDNLPWSISANTINDVVDFAQIYTTQNNPEPILARMYGKTLWYYLLFR
jgi:hypothetical protein